MFCEVCANLNINDINNTIFKKTCSSCGLQTILINKTMELLSIEKVEINKIASGSTMYNYPINEKTRHKCIGTIMVDGEKKPCDAEIVGSIIKKSKYFNYGCGKCGTSWTEINYN